MDGGQEIGNAIFDILMGAQSSSGLLTATWPRGYNDLRATQGFSGAVTSGIAEPTFGGTNMTQPTVLGYAERNYIGKRTSSVWHTILIFFRIWIALH